MKTIHKLLALALCLALLCGAVSATMRETGTSGLKLADEVTYTHTSWSNDQKEGQYLQEHTLTYTAGGAVRPMVVYGDTLYGRSPMNYAAKFLEDKNLVLVAGVNGSFFDMNNGIPYGLIVTEGILRSSGNISSIGFFADGKTVIGTPELKVTATIGGTEQEIFYNKALTRDNGIGLYSRDYDTATKSSLKSYNVVLQPLSGKAELTMTGTLSATVRAVQDKTASCDIPEDCFVLAIAEDSRYASALDTMKALKTGDVVQITTTCNAAWSAVQYACGGGEMLVENGVPATDFKLDTAEKFRARTAAGLKTDGTLILYTVDESDISAGLTLPLLAERMSKLGCVTAINLDGGGSTAAGVVYPGYSTGATVNSPSDGKLRGCANFIFLTRTATTAGQPQRLHLYPLSGTNVLPGARVTLTAKASDANYQAADLPGDVTYSTNGGVVESGVLNVGSTARAGTLTVSATSGALQTSTTYTVLNDVSAITVQRADAKSALTALRCAGGSSTALKASATWSGMEVLAQNISFTWAVSDGLGTVSADGVFTAADVSKPTDGTLTVSYGTAKTEIPVTISPANPFTDVKGHWAEEMINSLYFDGVVTGSTQKDGTMIYRPDDSMTRQEFVVALMRYLGTNLSDYENTKLPFADSSKIAKWASDAMKAAYAMGYLTGSSSDGKLYAKPADTISRQEAMVILSRTLPESTTSADDLEKRFSDADKVAKWAREPLAQMLQAGIISGSNGKLNPTGKVTRAQVAKMLYQLQQQ